MYSICSGGFLADAMGLGKTLTMLSAIVASKDAAAMFQARANHAGEIPRAKATLIVATSRRTRAHPRIEKRHGQLKIMPMIEVLDVWISEIDK